MTQVTLTIPQAQHLLRNFHDSPSDGGLSAVLFLLKDNVAMQLCKAEMRKSDAERVLAQATDTYLWRFASKGTGTQDDLDVRIDNLLITFKLRPVKDLELYTSTISKEG